MTDLIIQFLKDVNILQLFAMAAMFWFFYKRMEAKIERQDRKFEKLEEKIDRLAEKVEDIDRRLCRIEGSLASSGHCLFNQTHNDKKAG